MTIFEPTSIQVAVGAVVFHNDSILLVRRKNPPAKDLWAIPGGRIKFGETLQQAAEREIYEETGIRIKAESVVYVFEVIDRDEKNKIRFHYVVIDLEAQYLSGTPRANDDALQASWIPTSELNTTELNQNTRQMLKELYHFF